MSIERKGKWNSNIPCWKAQENKRLRIWISQKKGGDKKNLRKILKNYVSMDKLKRIK